MILTGSALNERVQAGMLTRYNSAVILHSYISLTLSGCLYVESQDRTPGGRVDHPDGWFETKMDAGGYLMAPGQFVRASTFQTVTIPDDCYGQVFLRPSLAREGLTLAPTGFLEGGFSGPIPLELTNQLQSRSLEIYKGLRVVRLVVSPINLSAL